MGDWAIGIDIGGTKIAGALVSADATLLEHRVLPTPKQGGSRVLAATADLAAELAQSPRLVRKDRVLGVGVGTGGQVETGSGRLVGATRTIPDWAGRDLKGALEQATVLSVFVDNDAKTMARAELRVGAAQGARTTIFLTLGTGVGGAVAIEGRVVDGARGLAGHLGHIQAGTGRDEDPLCTCGRRGCLEAYASGAAIRAAGIKALGRLEGAGDPEQAVPDASAVWEAHREGQAWASGVIAAARRALARVLTGLVHALNPDRIVLGGGLSIWGQPWCQEIEDELRPMVEPAFLDGLTIVPAALGTQAGVIGAALLAFEKLGDIRGRPEGV